MVIALIVLFMRYTCPSLAYLALVFGWVDVIVVVLFVVVFSGCGCEVVLVVVT